VVVICCEGHALQPIKDVLPQPRRLSNPAGRRFSGRLG